MTLLKTPLKVLVYVNTTEEVFRVAQDEQFFKQSVLDLQERSVFNTASLC